MIGIILGFVIIDALLFGGFIIASNLGMDKIAGALIIAFGIITAVGAFLIGNGLMIEGGRGIWKEIDK